MQADETCARALGNKIDESRKRSTTPRNICFEILSNACSFDCKLLPETHSVVESRKKIREKVLAYVGTAASAVAERTSAVSLLLWTKHEGRLWVEPVSAHGLSLRRATLHFVLEKHGGRHTESFAELLYLVLIDLALSA